MLKRVFLIVLLGTLFLGAKTIDVITIKGFDEDKLKPIIGMKVGEKYTASKVQRAKRIIKQALQSAGYQKSTVSSSISDKGKAVGVTFDIKKGNKLTISKIKFVGNKKVKSEALTQKLVNKEEESFGWFPGRSNGAANIPQLKYDAMRVQDAYLTRGYLDARVSKPMLKVDPATSKATVTYKVKEGRSYKISKIQLSMGKVAGLERKEVWGMLLLKKGETFDVSKLRKDIKHISETLGNKGYAYAKVVPGFQKNNRRHTIAVKYRVLPGSKVRIGNVVIKGNKKTKDHVVRRYVGLAPGDIYNLSSLKQSQKALLRTGYFDKAALKPKRVSSKKMDLEVDVKDAKTGAFTLGGGYGSADGWFASGSVKERNFLGSGIEIGVSVDYSKVTQSGNLFFKDPRFMDSDYSLSGGIFKSESDYTDNDTYENLAYGAKNEIGGYFSIGKQFTHTLYASVGYSYKDVEYDDINVSAGGDYTPYVKSSLLASLVFDNTDDYYTPREGIYAKIGFEYAGLGSAPAGKVLAEFTRYDLKLAAYYGMREEIDYDLILRAKFRGSYIDHDAEKYVPVAERLYLGGASRGIRGFKSGTISPMTGDFRTGGYRSYAMSAEASIPLSEAAKMRLTFFADYGQIGISDFDITQKSVGVQVEWRSPFGPINLIFAKAIDPDEAHGQTSTFEFNIGGKF